MGVRAEEPEMKVLLALTCLLAFLALALSESESHRDVELLGDQLGVRDKREAARGDNRKKNGLRKKKRANKNKSKKVKKARTKGANKKKGKKAIENNAKREKGKKKRGETKKIPGLKKDPRKINTSQLKRIEK